MKILLTGATGFIGQKILIELCRQHGARNLVVMSSKQNSLCRTIIYNNEFFISDDDRNLFCDIDVIIHAGAYTPKERNEANLIEKCDSNVVFMRILLQQELDNLKKFIFLSTLDVYGAAPLINEGSELRPATLYGMSKLYCEKMLEVFCQQNDISWLTLRIGHVYGPGEEKYKKMLPLTISKILRDENIELWGSGNELRSFIYIDDVVSSILKSVELNESVKLINVVGGLPISIKDLVDKLKYLAGSNVKVVARDIDFSPIDLIFDNSLLKKHLLPLEKPIDDGLVLEINHMKALM